MLILRSQCKPPFNSSAVSQLCYRTPCFAGCFLHCTCLYRVVHKARTGTWVCSCAIFAVSWVGFAVRTVCLHIHKLYERCWGGCIFSVPRVPWPAHTPNAMAESTVDVNWGSWYEDSHRSSHWTSHRLFSFPSTAKENQQKGLGRLVRAGPWPRQTEELVGPILLHTAALVR